jgi:hypothetical protein
MADYSGYSPLASTYPANLSMYFRKTAIGVAFPCYPQSLERLKEVLRRSKMTDPPELGSGG